MAEGKQPLSLEEWRGAKDAAYKLVTSNLPGSLDIADSILCGFIDLGKAASPFDPQDGRAIFIPMVISTHRYLLNAFDALFCGQLLEALCLIRPAAEMAGHMLQMSRKPELVRLWLARDEGKEQEKAFKKACPDHLPEDDPLTSGLFGLWKLASNTGMHSNARTFDLHVQRTDNQIRTAYFISDVLQLQLFSFHFILCARRMMEIHVSALSAYLGRDLRPVVAHPLQKAQDLIDLFGARARRLKQK